MDISTYSSWKLETMSALLSPYQQTALNFNLEAFY